MSILLVVSAMALVLVFNWAVDVSATRQMATSKWRWVQFHRFARKSWWLAAAGLQGLVILVGLRYGASVVVWSLMGFLVAMLLEYRALVIGDVVQAFLRGVLPVVFCGVALSLLFSAPLSRSISAALLLLVVCALTSYGIGHQRDVQGMLRWRD